MKLSVVIVVHDMARAAPRSVASLLTPYQQGVDAADYEVVVVDNGSPQPLPASVFTGQADNVRYLQIDDAPPSPARAINTAVEQSRGEVLAIMVDGAHMLSPGVFRHALDMYRARPDPLVLVAPFFLGPGPQMRTMQEGYDEAEEDRLLASIEWPAAGYRLFEISSPYRLFEEPSVRPKLFWFVRMFESNCLFVRRDRFAGIGGCDEQFDLPGGGLLLPDLYRRLCDLDSTEIVQLLGEASFHQLHGGISTNTTVEDQRRQWEHYLAQYEAIRGTRWSVSQKPLHFYGHMPNRQASQLMITG